MEPSWPPLTQSVTFAPVCVKPRDEEARRRQSSGVPLIESSEGSPGVPSSLNSPLMSKRMAAEPEPQVMRSSG